jgi:hypothetical protein
MTKGRVAMPAIQWFAPLGLGLLLFAVNPQAHAQQKMEFKFNLQDLLSTGKQEAAPDQAGQPAVNQVAPVEQRMRKATTREEKLEARRAQRNEMFKRIDESDRKRRESNVALSEAFVVGDAPYWMQRAEQCQAIMLKAKGISKNEKYKNPEMVASLADEAMECLWSLESELHSKGELTRLESCFAETFERLPARAKAESQHGVLIGEEFIGAGDARKTNRKVKNEYGIQNRPLIYLDTMWRATLEPQSALSYTQLYKMLFFDVGVPKRELNKAEIDRYQREKVMAERRYSPAIVDRANEYLRRMAGPEGDAAESQEQTRSRMKKFAECTPLGPMLGKPLPLIQKQSTWTFIAANPVFEKRTEKVRSQKLANAKAAFEEAKAAYKKRMAEIREARLQEFRRGIGVGTNTSSGTVVEISQNGKKALVETTVCASGSEPVFVDGMYGGQMFFGYEFECYEYKVAGRTWENISELHP